MKRPIGVTILAALSFLAGLSNLWRVGVYLGWFKFEIFGDEELCSSRMRTGLAALWALLIAAIWFWVAVNFWNMRAAAWQFGTFISLFTLIWGFFALLFGSSVPLRRSRAPGRRHLHLPDVAGRPRGLRPGGDVAPDPRAESRHRAAPGRQRGRRAGQPSRVHSTARLTWTKIRARSIEGAPEHRCPFFVPVTPPRARRGPLRGGTRPTDHHRHLWAHSLACATATR